MRKPVKKSEYCYTAEDIYEDMDRNWLKYKWVRDCILHPKVFAAKVFYDCFYEILLDIIHNNVTFVLPLMFGNYAEMHMQTIEGEDFKRLYRKGKFRGIDFLKSNFCGNQLMYRYVTKKKVPKNKSIYVGQSLGSIIKKYTEEGKQYY